MEPLFGQHSVGHPPLFSSLDDLCLDMIMSMLDRRSLLSLVICHRRFGQLLTYEQVISAARATESRNIHFIVERILQQAVDKSEIFMPSPTRLLRLINGTRCEHCRNHNVSTATCGLFLCFECTATLLVRTKNTPPRVKLSAPFVADASGECSGPCRVSMDAATPEAKERERQNDDDDEDNQQLQNAMHQTRIGWTYDKGREFSHLYKAKFGTFACPDEESPLTNSVSVFVPFRPSMRGTVVQ